MKIGHSVDPGSRVPTLRTANPNILVVLGVMEGGAREERRLHYKFRQHRIDERHEWFVLCEEIIQFIENHARPYLHGIRKIGEIPEIESPWHRQIGAWSIPYLYSAAVAGLMPWVTHVLGSPYYDYGLGSVLVTATVASTFGILAGFLTCVAFDYGVVGQFDCHKSVDADEGA